MSGRTLDGKSLRFRSIDGDSFPHGTVARYVATKCRCDLCRKALREKAAARARKVREAATSAVPNGPPGSRVIVRGNKAGIPTEYRIHTCPGTAGVPCVRGGAWLRDKLAQRAGVCLACVERATVWNGNVPADRVRAHLLAMRRKGIGYKTVASACDVATSLLAEIVAGRVAQIRAHTERRVLAVDEGCRTDGCRVPAAKTKQLVEKILRRGFTQTWLSRQLGCSVYVGSKNAWKQKRSVKAGTALKIEKLWRRVLAGDLVPRPRWVPSAPSWALLRELVEEGYELKDLSRRLDYPMEAKRFLLQRIRPETAEKITALHRELTEGAAARPAYEPLSIDEFATARSG